MNGGSEFSDEEIVKSHVELSKIKHEPTKNFLIAPLVFVFVFGCLIFVCSIQLSLTTNSFQLHPPVEVVELSPGAQIQLKQNAKDPVSLLVNGKLIAHGEVVVIDDKFGLKVTEIVDSPS